MILDFLLRHIWFALGAYIVVYLINEILSIKQARLYDAGVKEFIVIEKGSSAIRSVSQQGDRKRRLTLEAFLILLGHMVVFHRTGRPAGGL